MQAIVKTSLLFSALLFISGCAPKTVYVNVPVKCVVPSVEYPQVSNTIQADPLEASKQCAKNYFMMREYAEKLKAAAEVCQ